MDEKPKNYEVFTLKSLVQRDIESSHHVPMKVLCLGFPRTGTISLKKALERLGYGKCYHMSEWVIHPEHTDLWSRAVAQKFENGPELSKEEWDTVLAPYQAGADLPFTAFGPELLKLYPNTKVILTNKSPDALWQSWHKAAAFGSNPPWYVTALNMLFDPFSRSSESRRTAIMKRYLNQRFYGDYLDEKNVRRVFQEHYDEVRRLVPKDRLLEYRIEEGWEPLCEFLGEEVPDVDFPKGNSTEDFRSAVRLIWKLQSAINLTQGLLFVSGLWFLSRYAVRAGFTWIWLKNVLRY